MNIVLHVHRNHKAYQGRGEGGKGGLEVGKREIIYLLLHCQHQNDSCMKMGSDESNFKCFINCEGQSHKTVSTNQNLLED